MKAKKNRRSARGVFFCMERKKKRPPEKNLTKAKDAVTLKLTSDSLCMTLSCISSEKKTKGR